MIARTLMGALALLLAGCGRSDAPEAIVVFAAASASAALTDAATAFERETGTPVQLNFAATGTLARQIEQGAPAHLFVSANAEWMDRLEDDGALIAGSRFTLFRNALVVIGPTDGDAALGADWTVLHPDEPRIAMPDPGPVPLGRYAVEALDNLGVLASWTPWIVTTADANATVRLVERGEVDLAVAYASDVSGRAVRVVRSVPPSTHAPITYPAALLAEDGRPFLAFLRGTAGRAIALRHGLAEVAPPPGE